MIHPVCDGLGVDGIVTLQGLTSGLLKGHTLHTSVGEVLELDYEVVAPDASLEVCLARPELPKMVVVGRGNTIGVIATASLIRAFTDLLKEGARGTPHSQSKATPVACLPQAQGDCLEVAAPESTELPVTVAQSRSMKEILGLLDRIARTNLPILITGETGVGKELLTERIHLLSPRRKRPFIRTNCGAIPLPLLESELFGYERGAFTGARPEGKQGLFELAQGGTLLLDEIGEMPLSAQVKLLRILECQESVRVGGTRPIRLDVRVIATTNTPVVERVLDGSFRRDLYYRINTVPIHVPPLRDRREDIAPLVNTFSTKRTGETRLGRGFLPKSCGSLSSVVGPETHVSCETSPKGSWHSRTGMC